MDDILHIVVTFIRLFVKSKDMRVILVSLGLVEDTQNLVQPIVYLPVKQRYLNYYAIVNKTLDEWIGHTLGNHIAIIVVGLMINIDHWLLNIANTVTQEVDGNHRDCIPFFAILADIPLIAILSPKILAEAQSLGFQPCLLKFNKDKVFLAVSLTDSSSKVNPEH